MALNYSVSLRTNPIKKDEPAKAYATAQINGELSLKQLSRRISKQTTVSRADVVAVLISTVENLLDALQEGKQVDFGELGKFRLQILNEGAESLEKFTSTNITGVNIQYIPGEDLKNIFAGLTLTGYFETCARCRIPTRCAQTGMLRALATVSPLHARPLRPSEGKRRFPLISAGISLFIIHCSLLIINYHEEVCLEYHSQSDHRCCYRHRRGLRPASLPIVLASLPHPFPLPKEDNLPKRGHPLPRRTVFLKGPASPQRAGNGSPSGLSGRA